MQIPEIPSESRCILQGILRNLMHIHCNMQWFWIGLPINSRLSEAIYKAHPRDSLWKPCAGILSCAYCFGLRGSFWFASPAQESIHVQVELVCVWASNLRFLRRDPFMLKWIWIAWGLLICEACTGIYSFKWWVSDLRALRRDPTVFTGMCHEFQNQYQIW